MSEREEEEEKRREYLWKSFVGRDLTELADQGIIGPIYERKDIIEYLDSLIAQGEINPLLVGEPGVGKNAVVEGLACWIAEKKALTDKKVKECTFISFQSGCQYAHEIETKVQTIVDKLREHNTILFFDRINLSLECGGAQGVEERTIAVLLDPYLARNELTIIGATTPDGYDAMLKRNPSFTNRFVKVDVPPTSSEETKRILFDLKGKFEEKYNIKIQPSSIETIIDMSDRFYPGRFFPGKAFEILRELITMKRDPHRKHKKRSSFELLRDELITLADREVED